MGLALGHVRKLLMNMTEALSGAGDPPWWMTPRGEDIGGFMSCPRTLDDLNLDSLQKTQVLEWFAFKVWVMMNEGGGDPDYSGKSYDPLTVDLESSGGGTAHSYVYNFRDGGRHHPFHSLRELEQWITEEGIQAVEWSGDSD